MQGDDLNVHVIQAAIDVHVLDARIREVHVPVVVREVVLVRPR
jgi:hypothetical protein